MSGTDSTFALIRTDAMPAIGTGHAMRCLALAEALAEQNLASCFLMTGVPPLIADRIRAEGFGLVLHDAPIGSTADAELTIETARRAGAAWIVVDGYTFSETYLESLRAAGIDTLLIDDLGTLSRYPCSLVVNQNLHAAAALYPGVEAPTRLLLGTQYLMLRREFWPHRTTPREATSDVRRILVSMGGSDPENQASRAIEALSLLTDRDIVATLVVGAANTRLKELNRQAMASPTKIVLVHNSGDMPGLMAQADLALAAAGTTVWELAFMGVPTLLGSTVEAERVLARQLARQGGAIYLGDFRDCSVERLAAAIGAIIDDPGMRRRLVRVAGALVDGNGGQRVVDAMQIYALHRKDSTHAA